MNVPEFVVAVILTVVGVWSLVTWIRRPFESTAMRDQIFYALYRTGRVGVWFALAGMFYGYAFSERDVALRWLVLVPIGLAGLSAISAYALGRGSD